MSAGPCWATREEVDPRYDVQSDAFDPDPTFWAPDCGHEACVNDPCPGLHDWGCPVGTCRYGTLHAMCDLDQGHEGPHEFVSSDEIVLSFPTPPAASAADGGQGGPGS